MTEIEFSGYKWGVRNRDKIGSPGKNCYSPQNVWIDTEGQLHLRIHYKNGKWRGAEVFTRKSFGYGSYEFLVNTRIDSLNHHLVIGLFTWDKTSEAPNNEIDIEFSKWGKADFETNSQYVVQPTSETSLHRFQSSLQGSFTTHRFVWSQNCVEFFSYHGHIAEHNDKLLITKPFKFIGKEVHTPAKEKVHINFWLYKQPLDTTQNWEAIISKFRFIPE